MGTLRKIQNPMETIHAIPSKDDYDRDIGSNEKLYAEAHVA